MKTALVIGAGPAGLMAAEYLSQAGHPVIVAEAKTSVARKFLMAGKSGLNLTKSESFDDFLSNFQESASFLEPILRAFGPAEVIKWAEELGQSMFVGSTGRVFPTAMKASPLLRAWLARLAGQGVDIRTGYRWVGFDDGYMFETREGAMRLRPECTVLACGGASWSRLGSDGAWAEYLDVPIAPFQPANMGFVVDWSPHMARHFGTPVKSVRLSAANRSVRGEFVITKRGLEGGGIYAVSRLLREGADLTLDLVPDLPLDTVRNRLRAPRGKTSLSNHLRKRLRLEPVKISLLMEYARPLPDDIAPLIKSLPIAFNGPHPIDEAISTAGGVRLNGLTSDLMIGEKPGIFAAGEMLDWEAPTGGYLLTACLATGRSAGLGAARWLAT